MNGTRPSRDVSPAREGLAFALLRGVGCVAFRAGVERHGSPAAAFAAHTSRAAREAALADADATIARANHAGAAILMQGEPGYPEALLELSDAPPFLFALGNVSIADRTRVGIVGTRQASSSGERIAHRLAAQLAASGATIVSGMAFGIDAAAHRGALSVGGATVAVLGGGVDVPYPPTQGALHERIVRDGLVLSEAPVGSRPVKGAFPRRNRIIAALSELLIVVEAGERSGALITSNLALELGRTVAALPGPIDSPRHVGTNRLLASGAAFIAAPEDAMALAGLTEVTRSSPGASPRTVSMAPEAHAAGSAGDRSPEETAVLLAVRRGASDPDAVARATRLSPRELGVALVTLELEGLLRTDHAGALVLTG